MAIAFDAVSDGYANSTSLTFAHTCTGSDRFLVVGIKLYGNNDITGITYNGTAMAHVATAIIPNEGNRAVMYGLAAPSTGANNVIISRTSSNHIVATAHSFTGVSQTGQPEASGTATGAGATTIAPSATVSSADAWLVGVLALAFTGNTVGSQSGSTLRLDNNELLTGLEAAYDSNGTVATGSRSLTMGYSSGVGDMAGVVAVLAPATGGGGGGNRRRRAIICGGVA